MSAIKTEKAVLEKQAAAEVQVKTRKYRAAVIKHVIEKEGPCLCTAKKTSVAVNDFCSACGSAEQRQRMKICPRCGDLFCAQCWKAHKDCLADD